MLMPWRGRKATADDFDAMPKLQARLAFRHGPPPHKDIRSRAAKFHRVYMTRPRMPLPGAYDDTARFC